MGCEWGWGSWRGKGVGVGGPGSGGAGLWVPSANLQPPGSHAGPRVAGSPWHGTGMGCNAWRGELLSPPITKEAE